VVFGNFALIYFSKMDHGCVSCRPRVIVFFFYVVENPEAATLSRFFDFLLSLCKAGPVLQPMGGEH